MSLDPPGNSSPSVSFLLSISPNSLRTLQLKPFPSFLPSQELNFHPCQMKTFFQMPFPVNFISKRVRAVPFSHQDHAR